MAKFPAQPFVVLDFETSGPLIATLRDDVRSVYTDRVLGFGVAVGCIDPATGGIVLETHSVGILPPGVTVAPRTGTAWKELWHCARFDWDTFAFWAGIRGGRRAAEAVVFEPDALPGHLPALTALLTPGGSPNHAVAGGYAEAAGRLHILLGDVETRSPTGGYTLLTDCLQFDPWLASSLLAQNDHMPLTHLRCGIYRWHGTYDEDSVLAGCAGGLFAPDRDARTAALKAGVEAAAEAYAPAGLAAHHPQYDAAKILARVLLVAARRGETARVG